MGKSKKNAPPKAQRLGKADQKVNQNKSFYTAAVMTVTAILSIGISIGIGIVTRLSDTLAPSDSAPSHVINSDDQYKESTQFWISEVIDRVHYSAMTHEKLKQEYFIQRRPVVIVGAYADSQLTEGVNEKEWLWEGMKRRFGSTELETRVMGGNKGCTSTGLCEGRNITIRELFDDYFLTEKRKKRKPPYPHDIQLETAIPAMFREYKKLALFAENLLLPLNDGKDRWPSLFFGARGTQTNLHVDSMGTSFTMAIFRGRKQFIVIDPKDGDKLCMEQPNRGLDYGVGIDPFQPNFERCPSAKDVTALFADVKAGDILFVPGSYHHAARNLEDSVGISQNFLTGYDYTSIIESIGGYVSKLNRQKKEQNNQMPTAITMDFLALRDMFKLLAETGYSSDWNEGKQFWNANEITNKANNRIIGHMEAMLMVGKLRGQSMTAATRLANLISVNTTREAMHVIGAWDCLAVNGGREIIMEPPEPGKTIASIMLERLEKAFILNQDADCQSIYKIYAHEVETVLIPNAVQSLGKERGLSKHCC